jgi:hypothetical protein
VSRRSDDALDDILGSGALGQSASQDVCPVCLAPLAEASATVAFDCGHAICLPCGSRCLRVLRSDLVASPLPPACDGGYAWRGGAAAPQLQLACGCAVGGGCPGVLDREQAEEALVLLRGRGGDENAPMVGEGGGATEDQTRPDASSEDGSDVW